MNLGWSHTCDLNKHGVSGVEGHLGVNDLWFKFLKKGVSTYLYVFSWDLDTMARILERGITLFHPYSRNKSDEKDKFICHVVFEMQ